MKIGMINNDTEGTQQAKVDEGSVTHYHTGEVGQLPTYFFLVFFLCALGKAHSPNGTLDPYLLFISRRSLDQRCVFSISQVLPSTPWQKFPKYPVLDREYGFSV